MFGYDITVTGSLRDGRSTLESAMDRAKSMSLNNYPGRLVRVHGLDGVSVVAEFRNGVQEEMIAL